MSRIGLATNVFHVISAIKTYAMYNNKNKVCTSLQHDQPVSTLLPLPSPIDFGVVRLSLKWAYCMIPFETKTATIK